MLKKQGKKKLNGEMDAGDERERERCGKERDIERKRWGEMQLGETGERRQEGEERWKDRRKCWDENEEESHNRPAAETRQTRHILPPNKTLHLFVYFILLAKCWHSPVRLSRKPRDVFPACVWQGGSWGLKFSRSRSEASFDGGMLLFAVAYSQPVGNTSLGFPQLASC